jgi:hypothetical protein
MFQTCIFYTSGETPFVFFVIYSTSIYQASFSPGSMLGPGAREMNQTLHWSLAS